MPFYLTDKPQLICPKCGYFTRKKSRFKHHIDEEHKGNRIKPKVREEMESLPKMAIEVRRK